jgi:fatty-acyl-CoA synthase
MSDFDAPHLAPRSANHVPLTPLDFLARTLAVHPDRPAVAWNDNLWTYAEFGQMVDRLAAWLTEQGVGAGDVVSVMLNNRPEMLAAHYAVPALGAVLNSVNTRLSAEEVAYILDHSGAKLLICDAQTRPAFDADPVPVAVVCDAPGDGSGLDIFSGEAAPVDLTGRVLDEWQKIGLNYTSGTTGRPKGVVITHRGAALNSLGNVLALGFTQDTRYLWTLPMFHCNGWCHTWAVTAAAGLHVCLDKVEPQLILETIAARDVTHMCCAPVVLYMLLDAATDKVATRVKVGTGGAAPTPALLSGLSNLGFDLTHLYGLTEVYGPATINDPGEDGPTDMEERAALLARQGQRHVMAGYAQVSDDTGAYVPADGETLGEITLKGNTVMAGYLKNPEATEEAFEGGRFHTGDLAVMHPDGQIEIRDRAKDIIITGGENVSSLEIENVLHKHPDVLFAAVVAAPHPKWGETPWAFIEVKAGRTPDTADLDGFCREHLAGFKRPKRFVIGELPRTGTGKIQKFELRNKALAILAEEDT